MPLVTRLRQAGLALDRETANVEVRRWLREVANVRVHGETARVPGEVLAEERAAMQPLPGPYRGNVVAARPRRTDAEASMLTVKGYTPVPPQHDLAVYDRLLEVAA